MNIFTLWMIASLPSLGVALSVFGGAASVALGLALLASLIMRATAKDYEPDIDAAEKLTSLTKPLFIFAVIFCLIGNVIPSKEDIKWIIGGYVVTNIEGVEKLPSNLVEAANTWLEEMNKKEAE